MTTRAYQRWTADEVARLEQIYPVMSSEDVAALMGRTLQSVEDKAFVLGITKTPETLGRLRQMRDTSKVNKPGCMAVISPDRPTQCAAKAMRGVWYEDVRLKRGVAVDGNVIARAARHWT